MHAVTLGWSATKQSPTLNEPGHLVAGVAVWNLQRFDIYRVNPPLVRAVAAVPCILNRARTDWHSLKLGPGTRSEFELGVDFVNSNGEASIALFNQARWACIPFSLIGGWCCYLWGRDLYNKTVGFLACGLWCVSPNILAHGQLITPDIGGCALGLLASHCFWSWLQNHKWHLAAASGGALGLALLSKSTWMILFAIWPLLFIAGAFIQADSHRRQRTNAPRLIQLVTILLLALYVLNLGYLFDGTMTRLGDFEFVSESLGNPEANQVSGNIFHGTALSEMPVPLPREFVLGIDHQKRDFERFPFPSYLRGEWRTDGWWYYYLYGFLVKVPIGTLCLILLSAATTCIGIKREYSARKAIGWATLALPGLVILITASRQSSLNHHFRYALPMFAPMFIFAAKGPIVLLNSPLHVRRTVSALAVACFVAVAAASINSAPRFISFFNCLAGGAREGHRHLIHSNLDWGQDLYELKEWVNENANEEELFLAYYGLFDPAAIGVRYTPAFQGPVWGSEEPGEIDASGLYAVSINYVMGDRWRLLPGKDYRMFAERKPIHICGDTILIYRLP